jgi:DNA (cytosine-5)-methyltransferase 1
MSKPRLLDLFCGAGGAAVGYHRAGFEVVGVDIKPQPHYPFEFHQADAMTYPLEGFDVVHASPPCQHYSRACKAAHTNHLFPDLLPKTRERLIETGKPYIIENVPGAPMKANIVLCGSQFNLQIIRHRLFEIFPSIYRLLPKCSHCDEPIGIYGHGTNSWYRKKTGHNASTNDWRRAMGIEWMTKPELAESIPPRLHGMDRKAIIGGDAMTATNQALRDDRRSPGQTTLIKAKCPKCGSIHKIYDYCDDGHLSRVFCRHHKGLRQMDYFPELSLSPDIRIV